MAKTIQPTHYGGFDRGNRKGWKKNYTKEEDVTTAEEGEIPEPKLRRKVSGPGKTKKQ